MTAADDRDPVLAGDVLGNLLRALQPPTGRVGNLLTQQDHRIRQALLAAQKALLEPNQDPTEPNGSTDQTTALNDAVDQAAADRALAAIRREYQRHP